MKINKKAIYKHKSVVTLSEGVNSQVITELDRKFPDNSPIQAGCRLSGKTNFSRTKPEKQVENYLVRRCNDNGWWCYKEKVANKRGWPDRFIYPGQGKRYPVECKDHGKSPRPDQAAVHAALKAKGFPVLLIDTKEKVQQLEFHIKFSIPIAEDSNLWHPEVHVPKPRKKKNA